MDLSTVLWIAYFVVGFIAIGSMFAGPDGDDRNGSLN